MQETHSTALDENHWSTEWDGNLIFSHGTNDSRGVIIAFSKNFSPKVDKITRDIHGRVLITDFISDENKYTAINFYNSNAEQDQVDSICSLSELATAHGIDDDGHNILAGDLNLFFDVKLDTLGGSPALKTRSIAAIFNLLEKLDICDIFRIRFPNKKRFTFRQKNRNGVVVHRRLDYVFISNSLQEYAKSVDVLPSMLSDHSPVFLSIDENKDINRGKGTWKLNNVLLQNDIYTEGIKNTILETSSENPDANPHILWELIKYEVRKYSIKFSKNRSKDINRDKNNHERIVKNFESDPIGNVSLQEEYDFSKNWLDNWYDEFTRGAILRSKAQWYEKGEKSTKFFLNLEKKNYTKNTIRKLFIDGDNNVDSLCDDDNLILSHASNFYKNLFKRKSDKSLDACLNFLNNIETPSLSPLQKSNCDLPLDISELSISLDSMPLNKSPGNDGLTVEFYKKFWPFLKDHLFSSFLYSKDHGFLSTSQRQAVIKLLEKKDKDKRYIENWRPISLLNTDTKIISKAIANRLKLVLPDIICHDQTAYVNGRFIGESARLISDILEVTNNYGISGYILTADIEKAFDSMDHTFLTACLKKFGFGEYFCDWIRILLNRNESCVINGGTTSQYFDLQRGARQGDPIAAYLFIIALEIFFIMVRSDHSINKLRIFDFDFLLSAYADDTTFFVQDIDSIASIFTLFDNFSIYSGFKLNKSKCEVCGIGVLKGVPTALCNVKNINLLSDTIRVLGFHFSYNARLSNDKNFVATIKNIETVLNIWRMRGLTLSGKIIIFKTLAISKIVFVSHIGSISCDILSHLKKVHKDFIWDGKKPKIKHSTLIANYSQGGLKDIDIDTKLKSLNLSWIKRLHDDNFHPWKVIPTYIFSSMSHVGINIFYPNFYIKYFPPNAPVFYKNMLRFWTEFSAAVPLTVSSILSECVWNNTNIKIGGEVITASFLAVDKNIFVADLFDDTGSILPWREFQVSNNILPCKFFSWVQLLDAIPHNWKVSVKSDRGRSRQFCDFKPHLIFLAKIYPMEKLTSRELYNSFIQKVVRAPTSQASIQRVLNVESLPWIRIYNLSRTVSIDSYSRIFQYKCLNNILYLNLSLHRMGLSDSPLCSYCHAENETIQHLFYDCISAKTLWSDIQNFFSPAFLIPPLDLQSAIVGFLEVDQDLLIILNNILLMYKITLYRNRDKNTISVRHVVNNLIAREKIERYIVSDNAYKLAFHQNKWRILGQLTNT